MAKSTARGPMNAYEIANTVRKYTAVPPVLLLWLYGSLGVFIDIPKRVERESAMNIAEKTVRTAFPVRNYAVASEPIASHLAPEPNVVSERSKLFINFEIFSDLLINA